MLNKCMKHQSIDKKLIRYVLKDSHKHQVEFVKISEKIIFGALTSFHQLDEFERQDIAQSIFLKLFDKNKRRIKMWNGKSKFSTYLYMISTNHVLDYLGSKYCKQKKANDASIDIQSINLHSDRKTEESLINNMTLDMCKKKLRPIEKEIIELYYSKGYKEKEISEKLKISINTIGSIKSRALKKIRKDVLQEFWI